MEKEIVIIATGGTIAGKGSSSEDMTGYVAGSFPLTEILESVPGLEAYGPFRGIQFSNIDSSDMTIPLWLDLVRTVEAEAAKDSVAGIVVLHGTDTMEEGAYLLHLMAHTEKPIVLTGAMRPATAISADGPLNLLQAIQVCRSGETAGQGVVVVMNSRIHGAREVTKRHTTNADSFGNADYGCLGVIQGGHVFLEQVPSRLHTMDTPFVVGDRTELPAVGMLYCYGGMSEALVSSYSRLPMEGLVVIGLGLGMIPQRIRQALAEEMDPATLLVKSTRVPGGPVTEAPDDEALGLLPAGSLTAAKARILLMLALTVTKDPVRIRKFFSLF